MHFRYKLQGLWSDRWRGIFIYCRFFATVAINHFKPCRLTPQRNWWHIDWKRSTATLWSQMIYNRLRNRPSLQLSLRHWNLTLSHPPFHLTSFHLIFALQSCVFSSCFFTEILCAFLFPENSGFSPIRLTCCDTATGIIFGKNLKLQRKSLFIVSNSTKCFPQFL